MLDYGIRVLDTHDPQVEKAICDKNFKSRGFLVTLKRVWSLKPEEKDPPLKTNWSVMDWRCFKPHPIIGVDEAGRGCLAGPVFASAVILKATTPIPTPNKYPPHKEKN